MSQLLQVIKRVKSDCEIDLDEVIWVEIPDGFTLKVNDTEHEWAEPTPILPIMQKKAIASMPGTDFIICKAAQEGQLYGCSECGCTDIEYECWVLLNTNEMTDDCGGSNIWCPQCESHELRSTEVDELKPYEKEAADVINVRVIVTARAGATLHALDRDVAGSYCYEVVDADDATEAALDRLAESVPIKMPEDFDIDTEILS